MEENVSSIGALKPSGQYVYHRLQNIEPLLSGWRVLFYVSHGPHKKRSPPKKNSINRSIFVAEM
jgi:hypothetical protein